MADKMLDDDDIIDLTDLLEEGAPKKKEKEKKGGPSTPANEPDSFDLGKEISMEYEVSVEEIEQGSEALDIDASLSSNEEVALTQEKGENEGIPVSGETGESLIEDIGERGTVKMDLPEDEPEPLSQKEEDSLKAVPETEAAGIFEAIPEKAVETVVEEPILESIPIVESAVTSDAPKPAMEVSEDVPDTLRGSKDTEGELSPEPMQMTEDIIGEVRLEVPAMLEGIARPLIAELVKEMVAATREQLPGIVEKVIREEIEKLKKLDS